MCILFHKSSNDPAIITEQMLRDMWSSNPHGAGFAWRKRQGKGGWAVTKGFMTLEDTLSFWETISKSEEIVGHLRYATHGAKTPANCHPFAIAPTLEEAVTLSPKDGLKELFFHNGVLSEFGSTNVSDSADFCVKILAPITHSARLSVLASVSGRFAYIDEDGDVNLCGDFQEYCKGLMVSNLNWDSSRYTRNKFRSSYHGGAPYYSGGISGHSPYSSCGVSNFTSDKSSSFNDGDDLYDEYGWRRKGGKYSELKITDSRAASSDNNSAIDEVFAAGTDEEFSEIAHKKYDELCYEMDELNELISMLDEVEDADTIKRYTRKLIDIEDQIDELDPYIDATKSRYLSGETQLDDEGEDMSELEATEVDIVSLDEVEVGAEEVAEAEANGKLERGELKVYRMNDVTIKE